MKLSLNRENFRKTTTQFNLQRLILDSIPDGEVRANKRNAS